MVVRSVGFLSDCRLCEGERELSRWFCVASKGGPMNGVLKIDGVAATSWFFSGSVVSRRRRAGSVALWVLWLDSLTVKMENIGGSVVVCGLVLWLEWEVKDLGDQGVAEAVSRKRRFLGQFKARTKDIVEATVRRFNDTVFAYGQTNSGKTYTMRGSKAEPGVIPLAINDLFRIIQQAGVITDNHCRQALEAIEKPLMSRHLFRMLSVWQMIKNRAEEAAEQAFAHLIIIVTYKKHIPCAFAQSNFVWTNFEDALSLNSETERNHNPIKRNNSKSISSPHREKRCREREETDHGTSAQRVEGGNSEDSQGTTYLVVLTCGNGLPRVSLPKWQVYDLLLMNATW
ncbi:Kinesin-like protein [Vigna angularis]|uniref:Kinesin-like protein n=1 Tax=Phaseolus angularis TaxID=3914 RepID=A0A8T0K3L7_PHAAN|nr:Kinesin-like protein [Vigna angularis]